MCFKTLQATDENACYLSVRPMPQNYFCHLNGRYWLNHSIAPVFKTCIHFLANGVLECGLCRAASLALTPEFMGLSISGVVLLDSV